MKIVDRHGISYYKSDTKIASIFRALISVIDSNTSCLHGFVSKVFIKVIQEKLFIGIYKTDITAKGTFLCVPNTLITVGKTCREDSYLKSDQYLLIPKLESITYYNSVIYGFYLEPV